MPANYTVVFIHPSGATATFIYQEGELSSLAKGLNAEQFWTFKQVKALLLRNEEDDLDLAKQMMAEQGFAAHVTRALPDLLAPLPSASTPGVRYADEGEVIHYRQLPDPNEYPLFRRTGVNVGEIHWRENTPAVTLPPHRAPAVVLPEPPRAPKAPVKAWQGAPHVQSRGEIHWREDN